MNPRKILVLGLAAAGLVFTTVVPEPASAAPPTRSPRAEKEKRERGGAPTAEQRRERGMAEAPGIVKAAGYACTATEADWMGTTTEKNNIYEVACREGLGYIVIAPPAPGTPTLHDCLARGADAENRRAAGEDVSGALTCKLPGNANQLPGVQRLVSQSGRACTVAKARWVAASPDKGFNRYEVGCAEGEGFMIDAPMPGRSNAMEVLPCLKAASANLTCQFTQKAQLMAPFAATAQTAGCQAADVRWVTTDPASKAEWYEIGCGADKAGFMIEVAANGSQRALPCTRASGIAGGCKLTTVETAETEEAGLYTTLVKAAGYDCEVSKYRPMGRDAATQREVVEVACSNRPAGVIAFLPRVDGQKGETVDCLVASFRSLNCQFTPAATLHAALAQKVSAKGKTCQISEFRGMGQSPDRTYFAEVACSGKPGYVVELSGDGGSVVNAYTCKDASGIGGGCTLAANKQ